MPANKKPKHLCGWCQKRISGSIPKNGDGSALIRRKHNNKLGKVCMGSYTFIYLME